MTQPKILQIIGYSDSGKTSLVKLLLEKLSEMNYSCATIKSARTHTYHLTNKDSDEFIKAGSNFSAVMFENITQITLKEQVSLNRLIKEFSNNSELDLILIEGFKKEKYPKLLIWTKGIFEEPIDFSTTRFLYSNFKDYDDNKQAIDEFVERNDILFSNDIKETIQNILKYFIS
ncbi:MAG: Molybdopterin-guanine dinucleotide biosynthesis adapter protein [Candidatus Heimdallarchaeota archaeon AB_125]|nr:MAG: Molybdopterin-guanine dinucleotide biosynthesis adapter protein [Candidatus Heimdallarchaeota archaeon AB_125]